MQLRARLFLSHLALTGAGMLFMSGYVIASLRASYVSDLQADLSARGTALAETISDWMERGDEAHVQLLVARYGAQPDLWLRAFDANGRLVASSSFDEDRRVADWRTMPGMREGFAGRVAAGIWSTPDAHDDRVYEVLPLERGGHRLGAIRISRTLAALNAHVRRAAYQVILASIIALAFSALASAWLARGLAGTVRGVRDFAARIGRGQLGATLPATRTDELGEIEASLNAMSVRLATLADERRSFLANASHELRTPVSNVQATLEALEQGAADEPELRTRFVKTALDEARRMAELIDSLLDLGRLEAGVAPLERRSVDVGALVERCALAIRARLDASGVALDLRAESAFVHADAERLAQALMNVIENALKHAPAGSVLHLTARSEGESALVEVRDEGAGITADDLPRVFEQFFTGRAKGTRRGSGLGLAIAKRILEAHGGEISATNAPSCGAVFTLRLPRNSPSAQNAG